MTGASGLAPPAPHAGDDVVRPFEVAALDLRGRAIQMGGELDAILARHDYPPSVSKLLAEAIVLAVLLGSSLKFEGKFILQTETDGPVDMLVVDFRTPDAVRAYARFDRARVEAVPGADQRQLFGNGTLAMTVDQGAHTSRYQGIVTLDADTLESAAHTYFRQSEQIPTRIRLAVGEIHVRGADGIMRHGWRAGGILVQFLPEASDRMRVPDLPGGDTPEGSEADGAKEDDAWVEAQSLIETVGDDELTDPAVPVDTLLFRLFHERGVRVFAPLPVHDRCSCSRDRIKSVLSRFSAEEISASVEDGKIAVKCEFCGTNYAFEPAEIAAAAAEDELPSDSKDS